MAKLTPEVIKQIEAAAKATCLQSGLPEFINGPLGKTKNPAFDACVKKNVNDAIREARRGRLKEWFRGVNTYIQEQGGVLGLFDKLGAISESIRNGQTTMPETDTEQPQPDAETKTSGNEGSKNKVGVWIAVILLLALIVLLIVVLVKKPKSDAGV